MALQLKQYKRSLSKSSETNLFLTPWGGVVYRNCDELGDLLSFKSVAAYTGEDKPLWLHLPLVLFRDNVSQYNSLVFYWCNYIIYLQGELFPIYSCNGCAMMESVPGMHLEQSKEAIHNFQCVLSKAAFIRWYWWSSWAVGVGLWQQTERYIQLIYQFIIHDAFNKAEGYQTSWLIKDLLYQRWFII